MKKLLILCGFMVVFGACDHVRKADTKVEKVEDKASGENGYLREPLMVTDNLVIKDEKDILGYWVGIFESDLERMQNENIKSTGYGSNKINISIDSLAGDSVFGHSVVAGNRRPFNGRFKFENQSYQFTVREPGDDKFDGTFHFSIALNDSVLRGQWQSYGKLKTPYRIYSLSKRVFKYNPDNELSLTYIDWNKKRKTKIDLGDNEQYIEESMLSSTEQIFDYNPSKTVLNARQLEKLTKGDLIILRNSIYAKHGYSFKKETLRNYFDELDWYIPVYMDIKRFLTEVEKKNIKLMLNYEKHAEEYYDVFGR